MKKLIYPFLAATFLISCGGESDEITTEQENNSNDTITKLIEQEIIIDISLNKILDVPKECESEGVTVDAYTWNDANGINYFIRTLGDYEEVASEMGDYVLGQQYLYAYHYVENSIGEFSLIKETVDFVKECEFDLLIGHELDALTLTDIDEDEIAEITFIYRLTCTSDVSPSTQKLIMLENGKKYPLRGSTEVMGEGGKFTAGDEFAEAPGGFLDHAKQLWSENLVEYDFDL